MDPTPYFVMGAIFGTVATLLIQLYGRRKVRAASITAPAEDRAVTLLAHENAQQKGMILRLEDRLATLERIATDKPARLAYEIDGLR